MVTPEEFVREAEEHERIARTVRCKTCGAPKGVGCVGVDWVAGDGKLNPVPFPRPHHARRYKWATRIAAKFGAQTVQPC